MLEPDPDQLECAAICAKQLSNPYSTMRMAIWFAAIVSQRM